jgi:hypothetical protein
MEAGIRPIARCLYQPTDNWIYVEEIDQLPQIGVRMDDFSSTASAIQENFKELLVLLPGYAMVMLIR